MAVPEIIWPKEQLEGIQKQIKRAQGPLRKSKVDALTMAGYYLARSAAARTKIAPKKRKDEKNTSKEGRWNSDRYPYYREIWVKGPSDVTKWYVFDKAATEFKEIKNSGLAKKSWRWMLAWMRKGGSNFSSSVERRISAFQAEIELSNKLPYIMHALKSTDQRQILSEAVNKATNAMTKSIDQKLKRLQS